MKKEKISKKIYRVIKVYSKLIWIYFKIFHSYLKRFGIFILSLFEKHQRLTIRYNQYDREGEIIDVLVRKWELRKWYKRTPKHMKFKIMNGNKVELKTDKPMDYTLEDI